MSFIKRIYHRPHEGRTHTDFPVKASRNSTGLHVREEPYKEIAELLYVVDFLGSRVMEK